MNQIAFDRNQLQINFLSYSYHQFESDFYRYSNFDIPLVFLIDDILFSMAKSQKNYFKLNKKNTTDHQDHYFLFEIETLHESQLVRKYSYIKTVTSIP